MDDLVRWLGAQLDEDERVVRDQLCVNCGNRIVPLRSPLGITGYTHEGGRANEQGGWEQGWEGRRCPGALTGAESVQNPARVLREVDADRKLIADYLSAQEIVDATGHPDMLEVGRAQGLEEAVRRRASAYDQRPGYREEWRP